MMEPFRRTAGGEGRVFDYELRKISKYLSVGKLDGVPDLACKVAIAEVVLKRTIINRPLRHTEDLEGRLTLT